MTDVTAYTPWSEQDVEQLRRKLLDQAIREQIAPRATDAELGLFARVCANFGLSPFADQIVLVGRWNSKANREVHRHQITVAGRRALAIRTGELRGIDGPVWCGPRTPRGELVWQEVWDDDENAPYCARCLVYRQDWVVPANGTAKWSEFVQYVGSEANNNRRVAPMWDSMRSHMLGKCAESLALRRAFPDVLTPEVLDGRWADDLAELHEAGSPVLDIEPAGPPAEDADKPLPVRVSPSRQTPPKGDQAAAHKAIGELELDAQKAFLAAHAISDFGSVWPDEAVTAALELPM